MKEHDSSIAIELLEMKNSSVSAWKASAGLIPYNGEKRKGVSRSEDNEKTFISKEEKSNPLCRGSRHLCQRGCPAAAC
jgi:hypothetical protein